MEKPIKITNAKIKKIIISFMGNFIKQMILNCNKNKRKKFNFTFNYLSDDCLTNKVFIFKGYNSYIFL